MPSTEELITAVQKYAASHTAGDIDGIVSLFADDAVVADPVDQPEHVGIDAVRAFFEGTHQLADSLALSITGPIRAVDRFAAVPLQAVTTLGDQQFAIDIIDVFTMNDDGKFSEMRAYWSSADIRPLNG